MTTLECSHPLRVDVTKKHNNMNNMFELVNKYPDLNITIQAGQLKEFAEYIVRLTRQELEKQICDANNETYLSREEAANLLRVDLSTLWRWNKNGYLPHIETGGKRMYSMSEVKRVLGREVNNE